MEKQINNSASKVFEFIESNLFLALQLIFSLILHETINYYKTDKKS